MEFGHQKRNVKSLEAHENHNEPTRFNNDVAIITVTEPFDFSDPNVQPIEWFKKDDPEIPGETICNATGKVIYHNYYKNSHGTFLFQGRLGRQGSRTENFILLRVFLSWAEQIQN